MNRKVTFKEVAELAGVSTQTVSRVTNDAHNVNPETRKRVQEAIEKLGYVPNKGAQLLVRKKAKVFGVLTLDISLQGASQIVAGIRNESKKAGYAISLAVVDNGDDAVELAIRDLKSQQVDAIFINLPIVKDVAEQIISKHQAIPFVFIDVDPEANVSQVTSDHYKGAELVAQLMIQDKRTRFALINGPEFSSAALLRTAAWKTVIEKAGAKLVSELHGDWSAQSGYNKTMQILASAQSIDTLLVANDQMALGALRACKEHNFNVPQQIAVAGFDDTLNSEFFSPPLTTVRQNFLEIGHQAVSGVLKCINSDSLQTTKANIPVQLVERQSTAPLKKMTKSTERLEGLLNEIKEILPSLKA